MEYMSGAPKIKHTVAFSSYQTPTEFAKDPASVPTLVAPNDDVTQLGLSFNHVPAPTSPYLQPAESRPEPHIGLTVIPTDILLIHPHQL